MHRFMFAIPLLLATAYAGAQSRDYPLTDESSVSTVEVTAIRPFHATSQRDAIKGVYGLSNGWNLKVTPSRTGIVAKIDDEHPMHLIALSDYKFRTSDGNVQMEFNLGMTGEDMVMSYVPRSDATAMITIGTDSSLAAR